MDTLLQWARALTIAEAHREALTAIAHRVKYAVDHHVPMGGIHVVERLLEDRWLDWRSQLLLSRVCRPLQSAVCAMFGARGNPVAIRADQLLSLRRSRVARLARALVVDADWAKAREVDAVSPPAVNLPGTPGAAAAAAAAAATATSAGGLPPKPAPAPTAGAEDTGGWGFTESSVRLLRSLPLLRSLTLENFAAAEHILIVQLTHRPAPALLQVLTLHGCTGVNSHLLSCLRSLPALHTLSLRSCTLHDDTLVHSSSLLQERVLHPLVSLRALTALELDAVIPGNHFRADSWTDLGALRGLKSFHLNGLFASGEGLLRGLPSVLLGSSSSSSSSSFSSSPLFAAKLERLSLGYTDLGVWARGTASASVAGRQKMWEAFRPLRSCAGLRAVELSFVSPLEAILPHLAHCANLQSLLLGADNWRAVEDGAERARARMDAAAKASRSAAASTPAPADNAASAIEDGWILPLLRAPALRLVALYGFAGIFDRPARMADLAALFALAPVNGVVDPKTGLRPRKPQRRVMHDAGEKREQALRKFPQFDFER